nr:hypothetical protein [Tanacetum cinerariifolium]
MSKSVEHALTLKDFVVRNTTGKGSKPTTDGPPGFMPDKKLCEFCDKRYNQLLPLMVEKSSPRKTPRRPSSLKFLRRLTKKLTDSGKNSNFRIKTRRLRLFPPWESVNTNVFTRLGEKENDVFIRLGEREKDVFSCLGSKSMPCRRHASAGRATRDPDLRRREARNLVRSYVTFSSKRQREIEKEWDATDRANRRRPAPSEEEYLSKSENDRGGHWKSRLKKPKSPLM